MKKNKGLLLFLLMISCAFIFGVNAVNAETVSAPEITGSNNSTLKFKPILNGTAPSGTFVHVYIDGVYNGKTEALFSESGMAEFKYESFININPGDHMVWGVAEDEGGNKSKLSNIYRFNILPGVPAPTLFNPVVNKNNLSHPVVVGLSKNNLKIEIYIDDELDGEIKTEPHESGTNNFSYTVSKSLSRGSHSVYALAINEYGEKSKASNKIGFTLNEPSISKSVNEEVVENNTVPGITDAEIEKLIKENLTKETDLTEEEDKKEGGISPSLIIFILFFSGVVGWILWVNREIAKERKELGNKSDQEK